MNTPIRFLTLFFVSSASLITMSLWQETPVDLYHAVPFGIGVLLMLIVLVILAFQQKAQEARLKALRKGKRQYNFAENSIRAAAIGAVFGLVTLLLATVFFTVDYRLQLIYPTVYGDKDESYQTFLSNVETAEKIDSFESYQQAAKMIDARIKSGVTPTLRTTLAERAYDDLKTAGDKMPATDPAKKQAQYKKAYEWAVRYDLKTRMENAQLLVASLKPTPTPPATATPLPTLTPTPTATPQPTLVARLSASNPCSPQGSPYDVQTITSALVGKSANLPPSANKKFFELPIQITIDGSEKDICIASNEIGTGRIIVDDIERIWVEQNSARVSLVHNLNFYDPNTTGILGTGLPAQSVKFLFPKTPGVYTLWIRMEDKDAPDWSTTQQIFAKFK